MENARSTEEIILSTKSTLLNSFGKRITIYSGGTAEGDAAENLKLFGAFPRRRSSREPFPSGLLSQIRVRHNLDINLLNLLSSSFPLNVLPFRVLLNFLSFN